MQELALFKEFNRLQFAVGDNFLKLLEFKMLFEELKKIRYFLILNNENPAFILDNIDFEQVENIMIQADNYLKVLKNLLSTKDLSHTLSSKNLGYLKLQTMHFIKLVNSLDLKKIEDLNQKLKMVDILKDKMNVTTQFSFFARLKKFFLWDSLKYKTSYLYTVYLYFFFK